MTRWLRNLAFWVGMLLMTGCTPFFSKKPAIILILVESFSERDFLCSDPKILEGLSELQSECESFHRFTHSFTPSNLTQPVLATLFSGLPIDQHGVSDNGAKGLSGAIETFAEVAVAAQMRTGFFSGGAPLLEKFGVTQGFETFSDGFEGKPSRLFRPFDESAEQALDWLDFDVRGRSFLMVFYVPDILYEDLVTRNDFDDERPLSRVSRLQEFNETLNSLVGELKKRQRWSQSHVILAGVSGERRTLNPANPMSSEFFHVPLQIKLADRTNSDIKDLVENVTSFDLVGQWIKQLATSKPSQAKISFKRPVNDTFISQRSDWHLWLQINNWPQLGLRKKSHLFALLPELRVYDSFTDRLEIESLDQEESQELVDRFGAVERFQDFFPEQCFQLLSVPIAEHCEPYQKNSQRLTGMELLSQWVSDESLREGSGKAFSEQVQRATQTGSPELMGWLAYQMLLKKQWTALFELGKAAKQDSWVLVSQLNLRESPTAEPQGCLGFFRGEKQKLTDFYRHCQDSELRQVLEGLDDLKDKRRPTERFRAFIFDLKSRRQAKNLNLKMKFINDVEKPLDFSPTLGELFFFLPENQEYLDLIGLDKT